MSDSSPSRPSCPVKNPRRTVTPLGRVACQEALTQASRHPLSPGLSYCTPCTAHHRSVEQSGCWCTVVYPGGQVVHREDYPGPVPHPGTHPPPAPPCSSTRSWSTLWSFWPAPGQRCGPSGPLLDHSGLPCPLLDHSRLPCPLLVKNSGILVRFLVKNSGILAALTIDSQTVPGPGLPKFLLKILNKVVRFRHFLSLFQDKCVIPSLSVPLDAGLSPVPSWVGGGSDSCLRIGLFSVSSLSSRIVTLSLPEKGRFSLYSRINV